MVGSAGIFAAFTVCGMENMKVSSAVCDVLMRTDSWTDKRTLNDLNYDFAR
jgi:hypothetical protein